MEFVRKSAPPNPGSHTQFFPFLKLPGELRNTIYRYALGDGYSNVYSVLERAKKMTSLLNWVVTYRRHRPLSTRGINSNEIPPCRWEDLPERHKAICEAAIAFAKSFSKVRHTPTILLINRKIYTEAVSFVNRNLVLTPDFMMGDALRNFNNALRSVGVRTGDDPPCPGDFSEVMTALFSWGTLKRMTNLEIQVNFATQKDRNENLSHDLLEYLCHGGIQNRTNNRVGLVLVSEKIDLKTVTLTVCDHIHNKWGDKKATLQQICKEIFGQDAQPSLTFDLTKEGRDDDGKLLDGHTRFYAMLVAATALHFEDDRVRLLKIFRDYTAPESS